MTGVGKGKLWVRPLSLGKCQGEVCLLKISYYIGCKLGLSVKLVLVMRAYKPVRLKYAGTDAGTAN